MSNKIILESDVDAKYLDVLNESKKLTEAKLKNKNNVVVNREAELKNENALQNNFVYGRHKDDINMNYQVWSTLDELIRKYRSASLFTEVQIAIEEIKNNVIVNVEDTAPFKFMLKSNTLLDKNTKAKNKVIEYIEKFYVDRKVFTDNASILFEQFYVDGRLYIEKKRTKGVISSYNILEPTKVFYNKEKKQYEYKNKEENNNNKINYAQQNGKDVRGIATKDMIHLESGKKINGETVSYLHQALRPINQLNILKDTLLIYRIVRAPERLVFYIDTGMMADKKAKAHVNKIKNEYNLKTIFNQETGQYSAVNAKHAMIDNFWFSRNKNKATEVSTIGGNMNLNNIDDYKIAMREAYRSLFIPNKRIDFEDGRGQHPKADNVNEISEDMRRFRFFVLANRKAFSPIYITMLFDYINDKIKEEKNTDISDDFMVSFKNSLYLEFHDSVDYAKIFKFADIREKISLINDIKDYIGLPTESRPDIVPLFSVAGVYRDIMGYSDDEIKKLHDELRKEQAEGFVIYVEKIDESKKKKKKKKKLL